MAGMLKRIHNVLRVLDRHDDRIVEIGRAGIMEMPREGERAVLTQGHMGIAADRRPAAEDDGSEIKFERAGNIVREREVEALRFVCAARSAASFLRKTVEEHAVALVTEAPVRLSCHVALLLKSPADVNSPGVCADLPNESLDAADETDEIALLDRIRRHLLPRRSRTTLYVKANTTP